jgi:hypothetical protein
MSEGISCMLLSKDASGAGVTRAAMDRTETATLCHAFGVRAISTDRISNFFDTRREMLAMQSHLAPSQTRKFWDQPQ